MKTNSRFHRVVTFAFAAVCAAVAAAVSAQGGTLYWKGPGNASVAANWYADETLETAAGVVPQTGAGIVFVAASGDMTWDVNDVALASWTQRAGYAGTVTFKTGKKNGTKATIYGWTDDGGETRFLKITGDCVLLGGTWTHSAQSGLAGAAITSGEGVYRLIAQVGGDLAVTNATMDAVGLGFPNNGPVTLDSHCSSVHAGVGGWFSNSLGFNNQGPCYGTFRAPVTIGAGATNPGGGSIQLTVAGAFLPGDTASFTVQGKKADYYTGAGGSIYITAGTIAGGGTFNARGAVSNGYGGGGGGGRIAFHVTDQGADFSRFTGTYTTHAQASGQSGYGGTTYFETAADGAGGGVLIVDGVTGWTTSRFKRYATTVTAADCAYVPKKLVLRDAAAFGVPEGAVFRLKEVEVRDNLLTNRMCTLKTQGGTFAFPSADYMLPSNVTLHCVRPAEFTMGDGSGSLVVGPGACVNCDTNVVLNGSLVVKRDGLVTHTQKFTYGKAVEPYGVFHLEVTGDVTVEEKGCISAKGKGYLSGDGPTADSGMHAGLSRRNSSVEYHCYGSITRPVSLGGYGQNTGNSWGGGAVRLTVGGKVTNAGSIDADGGLADHYSGAGGSVWITAKEIVSSGNISANGGEATGNDQSNRGPGSGGRVALWLTDPAATFDGITGNVSATGGHVTGKTIAANNGGGAGTVYYKTANQAMNEGTLVLDNAGSSTYATEIAGGCMGQMKEDVTDTEVGAIIIRNGAQLTVTNATLSVSRAWSNETDSASIGGHVVFRDASQTLHVGGKSTFLKLECVEPGKQVVFGTGDENLTQIAANGELQLKGAEGNALTLLPEQNEGQWRLQVDSTASTDLKYLNVTRSDATGGQVLVAKESAESVSQGNTNWNFPYIRPGEEIRWTGAAGTSWSDGANWDRLREPCETDVVVIPATNNQPFCSGLAKVVGSLTVESGATLTIGGCDLTVTEVLRVAGSLVCSGTETIVLPRQSDFTGGTVVPAQSEFTLGGSESQTFAGGGCLFWNLTVTKGGGAVNFAGGFSAENLLTLRATGAWTGTFAPARYACARLVVDGTVNDAVGLTLTGTGWTLAASMSEAVKGVAVHGCTAGGIAIHPEDPARDDGDNHGWIFNASFATWAGGTGRFADDNCWVGGKAPDADSFVRIDAAGTVTIDEPVTVASLSLGGSSTVTLKVKEPLTVTGSLSVNAGGTLTADAPIAVSDSFLVFADGVVKHSANGDSPCYSVNVTAGDVFVEAGGKIDANGKGYATKGPGCPSEGCVTQFSCGAGHGGIGQSYHGSAGYGHTYCYGSFFQPQSYGSGSGKAGGGVIRIAASGEARIDGELDADGEYGAPHYSGSGGSVWITCARLSGSGWIHAHGGNTSSEGEGYAAGGGRVSLCERTARDWSAWRGRATAYGGRQVFLQDTQLPNGSAGTVYFETAADGPGGGEVVIDNNGGACVHGTELLPTKDPRDKRNAFKNARFTLRNGAKLVVREDVTVGDVMLETANSYIVARDAVLTIRSQQHRDKAGWIGSVSKSGRGDVVWQKPGFVLIVK